MAKITLIFDFYKTIYNPEKRQLFREMSVLLEKLSKKYQLILITTASKNRIYQIKKLNLEKFLKKIIICKSKSLNIFKKTIQENNNLIIIGDNEKEEILYGKILKIPFIKINPKKENPAKTIKKSKLIKI